MTMNRRSFLKISLATLLSLSGCKFIKPLELEEALEGNGLIKEIYLNNFIWGMDPVVEYIAYLDSQNLSTERFDSFFPIRPNFILTSSLANTLIYPASMRDDFPVIYNSKEWIKEVAHPTGIKALATTVVFPFMFEFMEEGQKVVTSEKEIESILIGKENARVQLLTREDSTLKFYARLSEQGNSPYYDYVELCSLKKQIEYISGNGIKVNRLFQTMIAQDYLWSYDVFASRRIGYLDLAGYFTTSQVLIDNFHPILFGLSYKGLPIIIEYKEKPFVLDIVTGDYYELPGELKKKPEYYENFPRFERLNAFAPKQDQYV